MHDEDYQPDRTWAEIPPIRSTPPCDSALEAMGWAQHTPTGNPGSRLTLMWIASTFMGGSGTGLDGIVTIDFEKIARETDQSVEDVEDAVLIFRALGLLAQRWVEDDPRDPEPMPGNRYFLVTSLEPERIHFDAIAAQLMESAARIGSKKGPLS